MSDRLYEACRKEYRRELYKRGLCIECVEINDQTTWRCSKCTRRQYVRSRIKKVMRSLDYYNAELKNLLEEDKEWKRERKPVNMRMQQNLHLCDTRQAETETGRSTTPR